MKMLSRNCTFGGSDNCFNCWADPFHIIGEFFLDQHSFNSYPIAVIQQQIKTNLKTYLRNSKIKLNYFIVSQTLFIRKEIIHMYREMLYILGKIH